jgi:hypothetical protein
MNRSKLQAQVSLWISDALLAAVSQQSEYALPRYLLFKHLLFTLTIISLLNCPEFWWNVFVRALVEKSKATSLPAQAHLKRAPTCLAVELP